MITEHMLKGFLGACHFYIGFFCQGKVIFFPLVFSAPYVKTMGFVCKGVTNWCDFSHYGRSVWILLTRVWEQWKVISVWLILSIEPWLDGKKIMMYDNTDCRDETNTCHTTFRHLYQSLKQMPSSDFAAACNNGRRR